MTEITLKNPSTNAEFTVPVMSITLHRLGILANIRKRYPSAVDMVNTFLELAEQDPTLSTVEAAMTGTDAQKADMMETLKLFVSDDGDKQTKRNIIIQTFESQSKYTEVAMNIAQGKECIVAMTDWKDYPKGVKFDTKTNTFADEFWDAQNPKAVLQASKFFRREVDECLSDD